MDIVVDDRSNETPGESLTFGSFRLFPRARVLYRSGVPVTLGSRALDLLIALVEHAGEVVNHRELTSRAWRGLIVEPGNLRVQMASLRRSLGEGEDGARYIANVPGQGYSFVAPVRYGESNQRHRRGTQVCSTHRRGVRERYGVSDDDLAGSTCA